MRSDARGRGIGTAYRCKAGGLKETLDVSQIFVEISTVSPSASRRVAEAMSAIGVGYIRSPVSGSTALAAQGL
jgi:3-hydroxyisobutyrate dehydrogenase-like beta-hydroxyacid dehydrogenase